VYDGEEFTALAYLLSRLLQAVWGTLGIYLTYRVGRRLAGGLSDPAAGRRVGFLAALLVAGAPWHLRQSAIAKPDALLVLLVLAAVELALAAAARPRLRRYLAAGAVAGLAAATKYTGAIAGAPLAAAALAGARRHPRRLAWLAAAGAAATAVFLVLDLPLVLDPELVRRNFGGTLRDYARKGAEASATRLDLLVHAPASLVSAPFLGPVFGTLGLVGLALLPAAAARGAGGSAERTRRWTDVWVFLAFPLAYVGAYVAATTNPSEHNWLPLLPFAAIGAAVVFVAAGRVVASRWPAAGSRGATVAAASALVVAVGWPAAVYVYEGAVPSTVDLAEEIVLERLYEDLPLRVVLVEPGGGEKMIVRRTPLWKAVVVRSPGLPFLAAGDRLAADAQVHVRPPREGREEFLARRTRRPYDAAYLVPAGPFRARGPDLLLLVHPWRRLGEAVRAVWRDGAYRVPAVPLAPGESVSWELLVPRFADVSGLLPARAGGRDLALYWSRRQQRVDRYLTERLRPPEGIGEWTFSFAGAGAEPGAAEPPVVAVLAHRWSPPESVAEERAEAASGLSHPSLSFRCGGVGSDTRRRDAGDAVASLRSGNAVDGPTPPQPEGRRGVAGVSGVARR